MMKKYRCMWVLSVIFILLFSLSVISLADELMLKLLPDLDNFNHIIADGAAEEFDGETLYEMINGGAELFLEYGFEKAILQSYKNQQSGDVITIEIYKMKDYRAAFGIYALQTNGKITPEIDNSHSMTGPYTTYIHKGNYFISISISRADKKMMDIKTEIGRSITSKISVKADKFDLLEGTKDICDKPEKIFYFTGEIALSNIISLNNSRPFDYREGIYYKCNNAVFLVFVPRTETGRKKMIEETIINLTAGKEYEIEQGKLSWVIRSNEQVIYKISLMNDAIVLEIPLININPY